MTTKEDWKVCRKCGSICHCGYFEIKAAMKEDFEYYFNNIRKDFIREIKIYLERFEDRETLIKEDAKNRKEDKKIQKEKCDIGSKMAEQSSEIR